MPNSQKFLAKFTVLHWALGFSALLHLVVLSIRFVDPEAFNRAFSDTPLDVILVNARAEQAPDKAQAIAQANLQGGGESEAGRAKSPLPASPEASEGEALEDTRRQIEEFQQKQEQLVASIKSALAQPKPDMKLTGEQVTEQEQEERRKQLLKMLAEVEERIEIENKRPKKRYISPTTREAVYAIYYDQLKRKVERRGTENFPEIAGNKIYGELTMVMLVDAKGRLVQAEVTLSSGNRQLDRMALAIVRSAAPFGDFSGPMRKQADQVEVVSRFRFARDQTMSASLEAQRSR